LHQPYLSGHFAHIPDGNKLRRFLMQHKNVFSSKQPILCDIDYLENGAFSDLVTLIVDFFHQLKVDLQLSVQKFSRN
jgi:hypothetical protein